MCLPAKSLKFFVSDGQDETKRACLKKKGFLGAFFVWQLRAFFTKVKDTAANYFAEVMCKIFVSRICVL